MRIVADLFGQTDEMSHSLFMTILCAVVDSALRMGAPRKKITALVYAAFPPRREQLWRALERGLDFGPGPLYFRLQALDPQPFVRTVLMSATCAQRHGASPEYLCETTCV